jgi:signal transduction histidine kinase
MVLDLLEISRMDAGTADFATDTIDVADFVNRLAAQYELDAECVHVQPTAPKRVVGDRRRLSQAIGNLIDNARNYAGGVTALEATPAGSGRMRFVVEDRGPGVPNAERVAIFGRFARGDAGHRAGASTGTGLGLSLVAEHIRLHGGAVWVEDNPAGRGARFVIELPTGAPDAF